MIDKLEVIRNHWVHGRMDTKRIAEREGVTEAAVYNALYLGEIIERGADGEPTTKQTRSEQSASAAVALIAQVAKNHGVSVDDIRSRRKDAIITRARQEAFAVLRAERKLSYQQIARIMGGWHHTTVIYGIQSHQARQAYLASKAASRAEKS